MTVMENTLASVKVRRTRGMRIVDGDGTRYPTPRRFKLTSLLGIRREMASVYRLSRQGQMPLADACKYAFILSTLAKVITDADLELRMLALERQVKDQPDA